MISRMKFMLICISFALLSLIYAAETVFIPENTLLFKEGRDKQIWNIGGTTRRSFSCEVIKKEKVFLQQAKATGFYVDVYRLKIPGADELLCYFPEVTFKMNKDGNFIPIVEKIDYLMFLGIFFFVIGLATLSGYFHLKSEKKIYLLPASLLFFYWGFASWYIGFMENTIIAPFDEIHYFKIAQKLLTLDFTSMKFFYTIGFPILCIPFIILFHLHHWVDFVLVYMNFQTFILIPCLFLVLYWFFHKKLGLSRLQSFSIVLLWLILMVFYMPMYAMSDSPSLSVAESYCSNANFCFVLKNRYFPFFHLTWLGRNAMCDYMSVLLLVILLIFAMKKSQSLIRFFILSMGFGFICLVRINYIFFAPLLAFVFYDSFSALWLNKRNYLYAISYGMTGFITAFVWQLIMNKIQLGSPFIWPYSLHEFSPDRGFVWNIVPYGFKCLCQTNYIYMILGVSSLFFLPDRKTRVLFALWIFPTLFFFCGSEWNSSITNSASIGLSKTSSSAPIVFNNPIRFIFALYPPLLAALVMNPVWKAIWSVRIKAALVLVSSCLLCKSNIFFTYFQPWNLEKTGLSNTVFIITQGIVCLFCCAVIFSMRKELEADHDGVVRHLRFLILFTAVFFLGSVCIYIAGILVLAAFAYGLHDTWSEIREINGKIPDPRRSCP